MCTLEFALVFDLAIRISFKESQADVQNKRCKNVSIVPKIGTFFFFLVVVVSQQVKILEELRYMYDLW